MNAAPPQKALDLLDSHIRHFREAKPFADATGHTVPSDTKSWSQILVSSLVDLKGRAREKGSDLVDGSDVKAANLWDAIDTPRFNGCLPSGRLSTTSRKAPDSSSLDDVPFLFFVMWDSKPPNNVPRCRVWFVRTPSDKVFRAMADKWYAQRASGEIKSDNFQLHPPRNTDSNVFRNNCGNLTYPLLLSALYTGGKYAVEIWNPSVLASGSCAVSPDP